MTGREALALALDGLIALARSEHPSECSIGEIAQTWGVDAGMTREQIKAVSLLSGSVPECLQRWIDEIVSEVVQVEAAEQVVAAGLAHSERYEAQARREAGVIR